MANPDSPTRLKDIRSLPTSAAVHSTPLEPSQRAKSLRIPAFKLVLALAGACVASALILLQLVLRETNVAGNVAASSPEQLSVVSRIATGGFLDLRRFSSPSKPRSKWANWGPAELESFKAKLSTCDPGADSTLREYFRDVVLIVNNNYEKFTANTTGFWRQLYSRFFDNIVFVSPHGVRELGIEAAAEVYPDPPPPWTGTWMYQFWALDKIMRGHPDAAGFLWTNEDVVVNYWNIVGADKTKLWIPNAPGRYEYQYFELDPTKEYETKMHGNWGSRVQFRKQVKLTLSLLGKRYREQYNRSMLPLSNVYHKRACDLFYIPGRHSQAVVQDLLRALRAGHLVSELALPLLFFSLDSPQDFSPVLNDMVFRWDFWLPQSRKYNPMDHWNAKVSALHPWKVSSLEGKKALIHALSTVDGCLNGTLSSFL